MPGKNSSRRDFMKAAGTLCAGASVSRKGAATSKVPKATSESHFDVKAFGATGDGKTVDTPAINRAIEAAAEAGGGTVFFPAGSYLSYSIRLKNKVTLNLSSGVVIVAAETDASTQGHGYDPAESNAPWENYQDYGHNHWHNSLIWGEGLENVGICGPGLIWGKGLSRGEGPGPVAEHLGVGNKAIALKNCRDILLRDFSILHGGHFGILATGVDNLTIDNLKIDTNRDGIDVDCCRNVRISNCSVNSPWDDAICLKSSFALGYARATEMVTITNCLVSGSFVEGTLLDATFKRYPANTDVDRNGRIKFGTESNGGYKNITISNCVFDGCFGLTILSVDGAQIEDVSISNITMRDTVGSPVFLRLGSRMRGPEGVPIGTIRRLNISNIVSASAQSQICSMITGIPNHRIEHVKISNILIQHTGGGSKQQAMTRIEEKEKAYPEPTMFGATPAHGLLVRHAAGIEISDYRVIAENSDERPCVLLDDVAHVDICNLKSARYADTPLIVLRDVQDVSIERSKGLADVQIRESKHQEL
jgi:polygalacturonase